MRKWPANVTPLALVSLCFAFRGVCGFVNLGATRGQVAGSCRLRLQAPAQSWNLVACRASMADNPDEIAGSKNDRRAKLEARRPSAVKVVADEVSRNTRWIVSLTAAAILLFRRDAIAVSAIVGALGNAVLSKVLKKVLQQDRPEGAPLHAETSDPGMPSSHAMSLFFFCGYLCAATVTWSGFPPAGVAGACVGLVAVATYAARWRVTAGFHTTQQVVVGAVLGGLNGVTWQQLTNLNPALVAHGNALLSSHASLPWVLCALIVLGGGIVGWKSIKLLLGMPHTPKASDRAS